MYVKTLAKSVKWKNPFLLYSYNIFFSSFRVILHYLMQNACTSFHCSFHYSLFFFSIANKKKMFSCRRRTTQFDLPFKVSPFLCTQETKPEARIRTCNDRPCPPRWNYTDFSPCSKTCGIGIRERGVSPIFRIASNDNVVDFFLSVLWILIRNV